MNADAPSGNGFNAAMDAIDALIAARSAAPDAPSGAKVWNDSTQEWDDPSGSADGTKFLRDDGSWAAPSVATAMVQLYDNTLGSAAASFDVSSGLTGYNHLKIILQARGTQAATQITAMLRLNNDSAGNYDYEYISPSAASGSPTNSEGLAQAQLFLGNITAASATANFAGIVEALIPNYSNTAFNKQVISSAHNKQANTTGNLRNDLVAGDWRSTAAINRVTIFPGSGNFDTGSRLTIYGLL